MNNLDKILDETNQLKYENDQEKACIKYYNLILELEKIQFKEINKLYYECAMLLFNNSYYEDSVLFLSKAYYANYKKREIKEFIFENFIEPNRSEFCETLKKNMRKYSSIYPGSYIKAISYEELPLEFIPITKNRYFIFDLELDNFNEIIDFSEEALTNTIKHEDEDEFSDMLLIDDFNLENVKRYMMSSSDKKIYYYSLNPIKTLCFLKLPNIIEEYLKNIIIFNSFDMLKKYFRNNLDVYIPNILFDLSDKKLMDIQKSVNEILKEEHDYRLSEEGRCRTNILLSICIPTWNRGNLALNNVKTLLQLPYDSEIEFVISDNGSTKYMDEYAEIKKIADSRVKYFRFDENMGAIINFENVITIANGKFALLLSDEDKINLESLGHYMSLLKRNHKIGLIRSATSNVYTNLENGYFSAGYDALKNIFLRNNYISGMIYNRKLFNEYDVKQFVSDNSDNAACIFYPHMCWDSIMALHGDVILDKNVLVLEGKSVLQEQIVIGIREDDSFIKENISKELGNRPVYLTYENRISQHYGFIELINYLNINSIEVIITLYIMLCYKTNFLVSLVKDIYLENGYDLNFIYDKLLECCLTGVKHLDINLLPAQEELINSYSVKFNNRYRTM